MGRKGIKETGEKKGPAGQKGPAGKIGPAGPSGKQGKAGPKGIEGKKGDDPAGPEGKKGEAGRQGEAGKQGKKGGKGDKGDPGKAKDVLKMMAKYLPKEIGSYFANQDCYIRYTTLKQITKSCIIGTGDVILQFKNMTLYTDPMYNLSAYEDNQGHEQVIHGEDADIGNIAILHGGGSYTTPYLLEDGKQTAILFVCRLRKYKVGKVSIRKRDR